MSKKEYLQSLHGVSKRMIGREDVLNYVQVLRMNENEEYQEELEQHDALSVLTDLIRARDRGPKFLMAELERHIVAMFEDRLDNDLDEQSELNEEQLNRTLFDQQEARSINQEYAA